MAVLIIVLRALHILGGVVWAGGVITLNGFVLPSAAATRPESVKFTQHLTAASGLTLWMAVASTSALLGGLLMFAPVTGGLDPGILRTGRGIALSAGALLGIGAYLEGLFVTAPTVRRLGEMARAAAAGGGPPSPEHMGNMEKVRLKLVHVGIRGAWMLGATATLMAVARYL